MKRLFSAILIIFLFITLLLLTALPASAETYSGTCGDNLTWTLDTEVGVLTISGTGEMYNWSTYSDVPWYSYRDLIISVSIGDSVTSIGDSAFYGCTALTSITIPDSCTYIGDYAFHGCTALTSITIPSSVTSIGYGAFYDCTGLSRIDVNTGNPSYCSAAGVLYNKVKTTLICYPAAKNGSTFVIPDSVTTLGSYAFWKCTGLTSVTIPDSVTNLGDWAFCDCTGLTSVTIPDSVTSIGDWAFCDCTGLTSVTIGSGVTSIGRYTFSECTELTSVTIPNSVTIISIGAFSGCSGLKSVTIPGSVTSIGQYAFFRCTGLTSIMIPSSVTKIGSAAFSRCTGLNKIVVDTANPSYCSADGILYNKAKSTLICYPAAKTGSTFVIPDSVTTLGDYAFCGCTGLTSITIPDSVTSIGDYAFDGCTGLTSITIPDSVTSIGNSAFSQCGLTSITIPDSVTSIGDYAFDDCTGLTSITIPDSVTSIGDYAFDDCTGLTSITIPDSVTSIGEGAFNYCTGLTDVYYAGAETEWNEIEIGSNNDCLTNAAIHFSALTGTCGDNLTWVLDTETGLLTISGTGEMYNWSSSSDVPWNSYRASITEVRIGSGVTTLGDWAFYNCTGLTSVTIGSGVTSIGRYTFYGCHRLASVTIPDSVTTIGYQSFYLCSDLTTIVIPCNVTSVSRTAFCYCEKLSSITVDVKNNTYDSRNNCNAIIETATNTLIVGCKSTLIPDNVTAIGNNAFDYCTGLKSVTIPNSVTTISYRAFCGCSGLTAFTIPDSVTSVGEQAFQNCNGMTALVLGRGVASIGKYAFWACSQLADVYYTGTEAEWNAIEIGSNNDCLTNATIHFSAVAGTCGDNLTWVLNTETGLLTISGTGDMANWTSLSYVPWYSYWNNIKSVSIGIGVKSIGDWAFYGCTGLTSVTIPDGMTSIGSDAFRECAGLTSVTIPSSVTALGNSTFRNCTGLESITIPDGVTTLGGYAFYGCTKLTSMVIPDGITCISFDIFSGCTRLETVTIGSGVTEVQGGAFEDCSSLTSIVLPSNVANVYNDAFANCTSLSGIVVLNKNCYLYPSATTLGVKDTTTIYGYRGSSAERYASNQGFAFKVTCELYGHSYQTTVTAPGCTTQGYTTHTCSVCGDSYKDSYTDALGHDYKYTVSTAPTASATGKLTGACSRCSATMTVTLPKLNTTDYTYSVVKDATCTATGTGRYTWKNTDYGNYYFDVTIPVKPHNYVAAVTAPGCTTQGYTTHTCSVCGDSYKDSYTDPLDHLWGDGIVTTKPTETDPGVRTYTCSRCGQTKTEVIPPTPHTHTYSDTVTKPTCTAQGYTTHTCSICGDTYRDSYTAALGHDYKYTVSAAPTTGEAGKLTGICSRCGDTVTVALPKLNTTDYSYSVINEPHCTTTGTGRYTWNDTSYGTFSFNVILNATGHYYQVEVTPPGCTTQGFATHTCINCGDNYIDSYTSPLGHQWDEGVVTKEPTDTEPGEITYTCSRCQLTRIEIIGHIHDYDSVVTPPTCTEQGYTTHTCSDCGDSYIDSYTAALGHDYSYVIDKEPTGPATGSLKGTCSRCAAEATIILPNLNDEDYTLTTTTQPTCTTGGKITYTWNTTDYGTFSFEQVIYALGHDYVDGVCTRCGDKQEAPDVPLAFSDVNESAYYAGAVKWAVAKSITSGTSATTFSPDNGCTRAQVVAFLWRAAGQPEPTSSNNPFSDVKVGSYYYKAVLWAVEKNVTAGTSATTFSPDSTCTRAQIVTFLWRFEGMPAAASSNNPFRDVSSSAYYYNAVLWAVGKNVTSGTSATTFSPEATCTRAQVVTFLYRDMQK